MLRLTESRVPGVALGIAVVERTCIADVVDGATICGGRGPVPTTVVDVLSEGRALEAGDATVYGGPDDELEW